jgi:hypothetical protein
MEKCAIRVIRTRIIPYRKQYTSLIEDKANYFNIKPERLFHLIDKSTQEQRALYEIGEKPNDFLLYDNIIGLKEQ